MNKVEPKDDQKLGLAFQMALAFQKPRVARFWILELRLDIQLEVVD
jgi:hypothetical protein